MGNKLLFASLFVLLSCSGSNGKKSPKKITVTPPIETGNPEIPVPEEVPVPPAPSVSSFSTNDGTYPFLVSSLNKKISWSAGSGSMNLSESSLRISIRGRKFAPLRSIYQTVYEGECPDSSDDRNGDGYVDIEEASSRLGKKILILDSNLNSENPSYSVYPRPSLLGRYSYEQSASRSSFLESLTKKYGVMELDLKKTVILFQGTMTFLRFPNSVASSGQLPTSETLPVGCASFTE